MRVLLSGSGQIGDLQRVKSRLLENYDRIIAIDGGARHLEALGFEPDMILGDFDSIDTGTLTLYREVRQVTFPSEKDQTDAELALDLVSKWDPEVVHAIGLVGSRWDHSMANLLLLSRYDDLPLILINDRNRARLCAKLDFVQRGKGSFLSLVPLTEIEGLTLKGVRYPLTERHVPFPSTLTVSNEIVGDHAEIQFRKGKLVLFVSED